MASQSRQGTQGSQQQNATRQDTTRDPVEGGREQGRGNPGQGTQSGQSQSRSQQGQQGQHGRQGQQGQSQSQRQNRPDEERGRRGPEEQEEIGMQGQREETNPAVSEDEERGGRMDRGRRQQ